ncbi:hypothetical protein GCM10009527_018950 [Actinomadura nitritigenes]|uniref:Uncharacterized protein n=1 Tax=Actinomadura nitritigenes TaxID=134602 RepID=A0ABS3RAF0_9ACTN|nr:hypothetical protein [Actinomadura nitritigenes]MBO2443216.1 hypothetical protein [Actinomadura nitritigenes]
MGIPEIATGALRSGGGVTPASDENTADEDDGDSTLAGLLAPLRADRPRETTCLKRQIGFSTGFYGRTDHWGDL